MKRYVILSVMCGTLLSIGGLAAYAGGMPTCAADPGNFPRAGMMKPRGDMPRQPLERLLGCLDLSETQQKEIAKKLEDGRAKAEKLHAEMREVKRKLHRAMEPQKFDEKRLRSLAAEKAKIEADLMVDMARTHHAIYALLTPEQQELFDLAGKLQRLRGAGPMAPGLPIGKPMPAGAKG